MSKFYEFHVPTDIEFIVVELQYKNDVHKKVYEISSC